MRMPSEPSLLWTELSQLFQPFLQTLIIFMALGLIIFGNSIFLLHWGAQTWAHNSSYGVTSAEEGKEHFPQPYGNTLPSAAQGHCHPPLPQGPATVELGIHQVPQLLSCKAAMQPGGPCMKQMEC